MNASRFLLGTLLMAAAAHQVQAADMSFSGAADGVDPLGHNYSFNGSTFLLSSGSGTFNPLGTLIGPGTVAASFSLALTGPVTFDPTPVGVPDACPPGQYAVYISFNPLTIICIGLATGPVIRHTWQYRMAQPGVITFDSP